MTVNAGEEFRIRATPDQELLRKLSYLAGQDSESVLTGGVQSPRGFGGDAKAGKRDGLADSVQLLTLEEQQRQERLRRLNERLDELDRLSLESLREAEERLDEVKEDANRTKDGRLALIGDDGKIYDETGKEVQEDEIDRSTWREDGSRVSEFKAAQNSVDEIIEYREGLEDARTGLENGPDDEELDDIEARIGALEVEASGFESRDPSEQQAALSAVPDETRSTSAARLYENEQTGVAGVSLKDPFSGAADPAGPTEPEHSPQEPAAPSAPAASFPHS